MKNTTKTKINSIFISDVHLLHPSSKSKELLNVLKNKYEYNKLFLIGDIIDIWYLKRSKLKINKYQKELIDFIVKESVTKDVYYLLGNHDYDLRVLYPISEKSSFIKIKRDHVYTTLLDKKIYLCHGDRFDSLTYTKSGRLVMLFGDFLYDFVSFFDRIQQEIRKVFKLNYWSLSGFFKRKVKKALTFINNFEMIAINYAFLNEHDGIMCGHIHTPKIKSHIINNKKIVYYNTGDWVETCSAIIEDLEGNIKIIYNKPEFKN